MIKQANCCVWRYSFNSHNIHRILSESVTEEYILFELLSNSEFVKTICNIDSNIKINEIGSLVKSNKLNSKSRRYLNYLYDLLISSVIRHDTGNKAGLALYAFSGEPKYIAGHNRRISIPDKIDLGFDKANYLKANLFDNQLLSKERTYDYLSTYEKQIELNTSQIDSIKTQNKIVSDIILDKIINKDRSLYFIPVSIDYLFHNNKPYILEIHSPPRGIELQFLGFQEVVNNLLLPSEEFLNFLKDHSIFTSIINTKPQSGFYGFEYQLLNEKANRIFKRPYSNYHINVQWCLEPNLPLNDDKNKIECIPNIKDVKVINNIGQLFMSLKESGVDVIPFIINDLKKKYKLSEIIDQLGYFVAFKQIIHHTWWDDKKKRVKILNLYYAEHRRVALKLLENECLVQKVFLDSKDSKGYHGELKTFSLIYKL